MEGFEVADLICFSHLRWNFVYQRPQHLMTRAARTHRVFFIEEPLVDNVLQFEIREQQENLWVIVPHVTSEMNEESVQNFQRNFLERFIVTMKIKKYVTWYYTPMAWEIGKNLSPAVTIYDCMDELSAFKFAPAILVALEKSLMQKADVVFTGGYSLFEAKRNQHANIHPFPSSIDFHHFSQARQSLEEPEDQSSIPHPRFGFYGVIDERMDLQLIKEIALRKGDWHFVLLGPVAKIEANDLPRLDNIHYLGMKSYEQLPAYLAGWDVAIMPFALNEATKFISPTKTPEYLAAGRPVISTPIKDVVRHYNGVVSFACTPEEFITIAENGVVRGDEWRQRVDQILSENSWDKTWEKMNKFIETAMRHSKNRLSLQNEDTYV